MNIKDAIENTKKIYMSDSSLNVLMDFERVLDELDIYVFENWELGELVEGPLIEKYWITCKFMWPYDLMPNPKGAERLLPYGCHVTFQKTEINIPTKISDPSDFRSNGSKKGKLIPIKVWLVEIRVPQGLIADIEQGSLEIAGQEIDIEDVQNAYQQGIDQKANVQGPENEGGDMEADLDQGMGGMGQQGMGGGMGQQGMGGV